MLNHIEKAAVTAAAYATWRTLRRARRKAVESISRFRFRAIPKPSMDETPQAALSRLYHGQESLLEEPAPPVEPPAPEAESEGPDGKEPDPLPRTREWWHKERGRQAAHPFRAGLVATATLSFRPGLRPVPPPGHVFLWGPQLRTADMPEEDGAAVLKILAKDVRAEGVEPCTWDDVDVVTPVNLVRHPVTGKPRLTHDERAINVRLADSTAEMAKAEDALMRGSVCAKIDLLMAFRHVSFSAADQRLMGFTVNGVLFRWRALTFGCAQSPEFFSKALAQSLRNITLPGGATAIVYVDDILVVAEDPARLDAAMLRLCEGLTEAGWYISLDKVFAYSMAKSPFLGLLVDLKVQKLRVTRAKAKRLADLCDAALTKSKATLRDLQRIGGLLAFLAKAAPEAALCRHGINAATAEAERLPGRTVSIRGQLAEDLRFWRRTAAILPEMTQTDHCDGDPIDVATDAAGVPSLGYGGIVWTSGAPAPDIDAALGEVESFAANPRDGATVGGGEVYAGPLPAAVASESSSALETLSFATVLSRYVKKHGPDALRGRTVHWFSDSAVAVGAVTRWRAKAPGLIERVHRLLQAARKYGCRIVPHWVAREAGWQPVADAISKVRWVRDSAEWRFTAFEARAVCEAATDGAWSQPSHDLFGSRGHGIAPAYTSQWPEHGNGWTDAFTRPWDVAKAWAFPPFGAAAAALRHVCGGPADVVIVIPRDTVVPTRLRDCRRVELSPPHLVDATGHRPPQACPTPLDAIYVHRTS